MRGSILIDVKEVVYDQRVKCKTSHSTNMSHPFIQRTCLSALGLHQHLRHQLKTYQNWHDLICLV